VPDSPLIAAGAEVQPSAAAPLHTNEFFTGMWTQGNVLGGGAVPFLYQKFYSAARFDRILGGQNIEVSAKLTLARRSGSSVYNSATIPPVNRFYEFRAIVNNTEQIHIMASCDKGASFVDSPSVRDVTGPNTNLGLWNKKNSAARTGFQSVGNILYFADGSDSKKWVLSNLTWGGVPYSITGVGVVYHQRNHTGPFFYILLVSLNQPAPDLADGSLCTFSGLTNYTALNGQQLTWHKIDPVAYALFLGANQVAFFFGSAIYASTADTGSMTISQANGFAAGDFIIDSNNNLELAMGGQTATITNVMVEAITGGKKVTLFFSPATPLQILDNISLTLDGLTTVAALNGATPYTAIVESATQVSFAGVFTGVPVTAYSAETGTATTGTGTIGATQPVWNTTQGLVTQDNTQQWVNMGPSVQNWGFDAPADAPTVTQTAAPTIYQAWAANTWYAPQFVIVDSNGNLQQLTTAGTTGGGAPAWNVTTGGTTADNTAVWTNLGPAAWQAAHAYAVGDAVQATFTYYITTTTFDHSIKQWVTTTTPVTDVGQQRQRAGLARRRPGAQPADNNPRHQQKSANCTEPGRIGRCAPRGLVANPGSVYHG
jgi:hypothetical protein